MSNKNFTKEEKKKLESNKYIKKVSNKNVEYTGEFKLHAVKSNIELNKFPMEIFLEAGIDIDLIGRDKAKDCLRRWRNKYKKGGSNSLMKRKTRETKSRKVYTSSKDKLKQAEARIKYLEHENEFLKKIRALEGRVK